MSSGCKNAGYDGFPKDPAWYMHVTSRSQLRGAWKQQGPVPRAQPPSKALKALPCRSVEHLSGCVWMLQQLLRRSVGRCHLLPKVQWFEHLSHWYSSVVPSFSNTWVTSAKLALAFLLS